MKKRLRTKFIFITGGVVSSLGKGIVAASLGALLENRGLRVKLTKADPYLNVDPGTMNPCQHGEVFVTDDGAETDLDIGHYERFTSAVLTRLNSFSSGQIYDAVLTKERRGEYQGGTVQVIPHVTNQIKEHIYKSAEGADIAIVEIGGTVGDIESLPFLESIRQIRYDLGEQNVLFIHLTLVPYISAAQELKTKPTQHSVKELRQLGIQPHVIVCRSDRSVPLELRDKIAQACDLKLEHVISCPDLDSIYKIPNTLNDQGLDQIVVDLLNIWTRSPQLNQWKAIAAALDRPEQSLRIGVVGKYTGVIDSYKSIGEALIHAGIQTRTRMAIDYVDAESLTSETASDKLSEFDGIIVPGGFGNRGIDGKLLAIRHARIGHKPFLGICLGMQLAAVEFARSVCKIEHCGSQEFEPNVKHPIIHLMEEQKSIKALGGTMRLGAYPCRVLAGSRAFDAYQSQEISERHRHRYEFNNDYRDKFDEAGMMISGLSPDGNLVEMIELRDHPWFVACQFHPELKSKPMDPHPLFRDFVKACLRASLPRA